MTRLALFILVLTLATPVSGSISIPDVGIEQRLNEQIPLDLQFRDETGRSVRLGDYFGRRPVILTPVYYTCPMLCTLVLSGVTESLSNLTFNVGQQFEVITFSFDPRDTAQNAASTKAIRVRQYGRPGADAGWHFLTGDDASIRSLTGALGFRYTFDPETKQFAHGSGIVVLTPQGKISRYFYGIQYPAKDLRLSLVEASANRIGSPVDQVLLLCYHYDLLLGKYSALTMDIVRLGAALTLLLLAGLVFRLLRRETAGRVG